MAFGVTSSGFNLKRFDDVRESLVSRASNQVAILGLDTDSETVFGQMLDIQSGEMADMWEMALAVSQLTNPESVEDVFLDNAGALVGVERQEAASTSSYIRYIGDEGTQIVTSVKVGVPGKDKVFSPDENKILEVAAPISYVKILFTSATTTNVFSVNIDGNTVSYDGSPSLVTAADSASGLVAEIVGDGNVNTIVDAYIDPEDTNFETVIIESISGSFNFQFSNLATTWSTTEKIGFTLPSSCNRVGEVELEIGEANQVIETVTGLDSATNLTKGILGRQAETDQEFRSRRRDSLAIIGSGTLDSIIDHVANLDGIVRTTGVENITNSTDAGGRPGKSFEIIVTGGEDEEVAQAIWDTKPAGIETYGNVNGGVGIVAVDNSGNNQLVKFSRPVERAISVLIKYQLYDEEAAPTNIQLAIDTALLAYADTLIPGKDVIPQRFGNAVFNGVSGLQIVEAYITISADATSPSAPTGVAGEQIVVAIGEVDYLSLDQVDIIYAVIQ